MFEKILITGATGFIGRKLVDTLSKDATIKVVATSRHEFEQTAQNIETVKVPDLSESNHWSEVLDGVSHVVHLAARVHIMQDKSADPLHEYRKANTDGTISLARQAAAVGVKRFIFLSTIKVNGEKTELGSPFRESDSVAPTDPYAISKWETEQRLYDISKNTGMEIVIIRPPLVYGSGVKANFRTIINLVNKGIPLPLGAADCNKRSLVAIDNLVDFIIVCLQHPAAINQVFLVSDGEDLSIKNLIQRIAHASGKTARLLPVPLWQMRKAAQLLGKTAVTDRLLDSLQVDISKARKMLDWTPPVVIDQALKEIFQEQEQVK